MSKENKKSDRVLFYAIFALLVFGLMMIASAGVSYSKTRFGDAYFFFKRQLLGVSIGLIVLYFAQKVSYNFWKKMALPFFIASVALLVLVFVPGIGSKIYGASRWIQLGAVSFQPSEMLKISIIIYLAAWLESRGERTKDFFEGFVPFIAMLGLVGFLLMKQPDMGTMGVVILMAVSIFFIAGSKISHLLLMLVSGIVSLAALIKMEAYRMDRLTVFLHPELDPKGIGYQINQALLAIGSGGIFGAGLGHSLQKFNYLPEPVGDSIFAIIGEELGILGCVVVVGLFVTVAARGMKIARQAPDLFSKYAAVGISSWIFFQAAINISAISGLIPLTGIPLPFISYGGTSIIFLMAGAGILLNISKYAKV